MIHFLDWAVAILTILYAVLLMAYRYWFSKLQIFKDPSLEQNNIQNVEQAPTRFSIIIPARNEAASIKTCVDSILKQNYPIEAFEIIVIDDFSEDDTAFIVTALQQQYANLHLLRLADYYKPGELTAFKKKAIEKAVSHAKGEWIVTTDADCIVPVDWLQLYHQYIQKEQPVFVAAPVMFIKTKGILNQFQLLDFLALQGITAAAVGAGKHSMSNGANLAFKKTAFIAVGGYQGVDNIASGDDMLLMHKMKQTLAQPIGYLFHPGAIVLTHAMTTWKDFVMQRIRWASKARYYDDKSIFAVLLLVYLFNFSFLLLLLVGSYKSALLAILFKTFFEQFFLVPVANFYGLGKELRFFIAYQPLHIIYNIIAGFFGQIKTYTWKGRKVK